MSDKAYFETQKTLLMSYLCRNAEAMSVLEETFRAIFRLIDNRAVLAIKVGDAAVRLSEDLAAALNSTCADVAPLPAEYFRTPPPVARVVRGLCIIDGGKDDPHNY